MNNQDALKRKVDELENLAREIQKLGVELLEEAEIVVYDEAIYFRKPKYNSHSKEKQREALQKYQQWYSTTLRLIEEYTPEWSKDFQMYYTIDSYGGNAVINYLEMGRSSFRREDRNDLIDDFLHGFDRQLAILSSIPKVVEIAEMKLRNLISADLVRTEIEEAEVLLAAGHYRAAGAIAGVALELHLKTICDVNEVSYAPKATLDPLAQALYKDGKIDITELKHIQYLASIRNKCSHPTSISEAEVKALIEEVKKLA